MTEKNIEILAVEEQRKYHKQWRDKNKAKIKSYNANYWKKRAKKIAEATKDDKSYCQ